MNAIESKALEISRGTFHLGPVDIAIEEGEIFAILGRTGSGKTVLLETLAGFYQGEYDGEIKLFGHDADSIPPDKREMAFVYQDSGLFPHMTVENNIAYGLRRHKVAHDAIEKKIKDITEMLGISHIRKQYPATISGGERQRTALARSLVLSPRILLLDEPFSALDPATRLRMYDEIKRIHETFKCTIVFVTHDFGEAQHLAHRIGIILAGKLRAVVKSDALFENEYDKDIQEFLKG